MTPAEIRALVRTIPDFPRAGVQFRDVTPLIGDADGFAATVDWLAEKVAGAEAIAGMEARGFIFGAAVATRAHLPFLPIRKSGKLPCAVIGVDYELEYGLDRLEMDPAAVSPGQPIAIVDDLLATGGTALAAAELLRKAGACVEQAAFVIGLPDLGGQQRLAEAGLAAHALMEFQGD